MATETMAHELGEKLYKLDLANVVSKYFGKIQKNLLKIYIETETNNAVLFFAEDDALFDKRCEMRDSHDRYANIGMGYLL